MGETPPERDANVRAAVSPSMTTTPLTPRPLLDFGPRPLRVLAVALAAAAALASASAAPAHALPDGCAANPECLIEHVFGGSGVAPVQPAASVPAIRVVPSAPLVTGAGRRALVTVRVRVSGVSVLEARVARRRAIRRLVGPGEHDVKVSLRGVRPGRHRIELSVTDGAGRRGATSAEVVVVAPPARVER